MRYSLVLVFLIQFGTTLSFYQDYYWREYNGTIPEDAIAGGTTTHGTNIYIGQAYIQDRGLIVVEIYPGKLEVVAPIYGVKKTVHYTKVLCGFQANFLWISANSTSLHLLLIDEHAVIGGHEDGDGGHGVLNIGRVNHETDTRIGKIIAFSIGNAWLYFVHENKELMRNSYQILVFKKNEFDLRSNLEQ